jgi:hypothetical protein
MTSFILYPNKAKMTGDWMNAIKKKGGGAGHKLFAEIIGTRFGWIRIAHRFTQKLRIFIIRAVA